MRWWRKLVSLITIEINVYIYYMKRQINTIFSPQKLLLYLSEKIVWAKQFFQFPCTHSYKNILCYFVSPCVAPSVNFAVRTSEAGSCEGENSKNDAEQTPKARKVENVFIENEELRESRVNIKNKFSNKQNVFSLFIRRLRYRLGLYRRSVSVYEIESSFFGPQNSSDTSFSPHSNPD